MKDLDQINSATSVKDIEDGNYKTCPMIILHDKFKGTVEEIYIASILDEDLIDTKMFTNTKKISSQTISDVTPIIEDIKKQIDQKEASGDIYVSDSGEIEYDIIDELYLDEIKKKANYVASKNTGSATVQSAPNNSIPLNTSQDVQAAIGDMNQFGGEKLYSIGNKVKRGYLVSIIQDYNQNGKLRAVANDGVNGVAFSAFPTSMRVRRTVYIVSNLQYIDSQGRVGNYRVSNSEDLSFSASY